MGQSELEQGAWLGTSQAEHQSWRTHFWTKEHPRRSRDRRAVGGTEQAETAPPQPSLLGKCFTLGPQGQTRSWLGGQKCLPAPHQLGKGMVHPWGSAERAGSSGPPHWGTGIPEQGWMGERVQGCPRGGTAWAEGLQCPQDKPQCPSSHQLGTGQ